MHVLRWLCDFYFTVKESDLQIDKCATKLGKK